MAVLFELQCDALIRRMRDEDDCDYMLAVTPTGSGSYVARLLHEGDPVEHVDGEWLRVTAGTSEAACERLLPMLQEFFNS